MVGMTDQLGLAEGRPFTVADLETMPDDGRRYELLDGMLLVSPGPTWSHQEMVASVYVELRRACPPEFRVLLAPFGVRTSPQNEVQPDVLVARFTELAEDYLPTAPVLAVEVLSPSTELHDRNTKMAHYARIGVPSYWILDPREPGAIEVHRLAPDGTYDLIASACGEEVVGVSEPFLLDLTPARLLDGRRPR
ncbi:Uma2 family endonuclease [Sporichthya brevicatena]|uniref:Uma2 family endonuclease n=2 Tax=Sporichthya brevicatena TaxID=171442 RepID=A0ABN1HB66_9ACTN